MKKTLTKTLLASGVLVTAACENPADKTTDATVSEKVEVTETKASADATSYSFSDDSEIKWRGSKVTGSHDGGFKTFSGQIAVEDGKLSGSGQTITIDMNSIWSDNEKLTEHLKSEDFMNISKFPESTFQLTGITTEDGKNYKVSGNLTLMETTKNITFPAEVKMDGDSAKIHAEFDINRKDFGIVYAGKPDDLIRDEVVIELVLTAVPGS